MVKKRSVFDINFDLDEEEDAGFPAGNAPAESPVVKEYNIQGHPLQNSDPVPNPPAPSRRGPMASAISETLEATSERASAEAAIRAENDALAHEHVRLKRLGLITDLIQTSDVHTDKLTRDRSANVDPELAELKQSIQSVGLSNPIRVEQTDNGYELIQGFRRLTAFRELAAETGDPRYSRIPAALVPRGEPLADLYRKMVDENLVRKDLSFGEMARLALSYAQDSGVEVSDAVGTLYASALKQKKTYIRQFARVLADLDGALRYPEAIPRALGLDVYRFLDATGGDAGDRVGREGRDALAARFLGRQQGAITARDRGVPCSAGSERLKLEGGRADRLAPSSLRRVGPNGRDRPTYTRQPSPPCPNPQPLLYSCPIRIVREGAMGRVKVNLTLDASVAETARALGLNMSRLAEAAISDAAKAERNRRWRIENQQALDAYAQEVEAEGLPLERFRSF